MVILFMKTERLKEIKILLFREKKCTVKTKKKLALFTNIYNFDFVVLFYDAFCVRLHSFQSFST